MTVLGSVDPHPLAGRVHRRHVIYESLSAPDSDVTVPAGGTETVSVDIASESPRDIGYAGLESISGLPADVYVSGISVDKTGKTLTLTLFNASGADVVVSAGSLTLGVVSYS